MPYNYQFRNYKYTNLIPINKWYRNNYEIVNELYDKYICLYNISFDDWVHYCHSHSYSYIN
jgi:hypothetical protein